ncbi:hypothetical protein chiPu_0016987 [Chiloscyllium punctatum]|uniref:Uncharacterized protein n=1 Tax=Chiloscyllium punctatum TaxID=137246 RepID=A0A401T724_CHIPU|nr:hypothetical protein [Chiloscyllium punctatum]
MRRERAQPNALHLLVASTEVQLARGGGEGCGAGRGSPAPAPPPRTLGTRAARGDDVSAVAGHLRQKGRPPRDAPVPLRGESEPVIVSACYCFCQVQHLPVIHTHTKQKEENRIELLFPSLSLPTKIHSFFEKISDVWLQG